MKPANNPAANREKVMTLELSPVELDEAMQAYFAKCQEKLGFIPNVLTAYSFDLAKLKAFIAMSDDLMLGKSGLSKTEREMIAVVVSSANHCHYCLVAHGAAPFAREHFVEVAAIGDAGQPVE